MREIKFRMWDGKEMYLPEYSEEEQFYLTADGVAKYQNTSGYYANTYNNYHSKNVVLMQYTGLKDKNGIEIYEGDIIIPNKSFGPGKVVFATPKFGLENSKGVCTDWEWDEWEKFEIIGNIYEHPELLTQKTEAI